MNVQDLIKHLEQYEPDMPVHFAFPSGDYWHTTLAREVKTVEEREIEYSQYHSEDRLAYEEGEEEAKTVLVLS